MASDGAKTTFGFSKKLAKKKDVGVNGKAEDEGARKEYLSGMDGSGLELKEKKVQEVKAIPVQENTFEVGTGRRRKAPSFLPDQAAVEEDNERFEVADQISAGGETAQHGVRYGLTKMGPKSGEGHQARKVESEPGKIVERLRPCPRYSLLMTVRSPDPSGA